MGKVLGFAVLFGIVGILIGQFLAGLNTHGNPVFRFDGVGPAGVIRAIYLAIGAGAGGLVGALAGIGWILDEAFKTKLRQSDHSRSRKDTRDDVDDGLG